MKKILGLAIALAFVSSSVLAGTPTTTTTPATTPTAAPIATNVDKNAEMKARETCTKKGLAGGWLDECIKGEIAKMNTNTINPAVNTNAAQNTNKPTTSN